MTDPVHPPAEPDSLRPRWRNLAVAGLGAPYALADAGWDRIVDAYGAEGRAYHTLGHLSAMLSRLAGWRWRLRDWRGVELAVWLHDVVYDRAPGADERASAALARAFIAEIDAAVDPRPDRTRAAETAERLILATIDHTPIGADLDDRLFLDADLEILAAPPERYAAYAAAIRFEYAAVPEPLFRAGRKQVLERLRDRPAIYYETSAWEAPARDNIAAEIAALEA